MKTATEHFISNNWKFDRIFLEDGVAVYHVSPASGPVSRASGYELVLLAGDQYPTQAGSIFDYGFDGRDSALAVAEQLVKIDPNKRSSVAAGFYSKFRNNILYGTTQATQWSVSPVIA